MTIAAVTQGRLEPFQGFFLRLQRTLRAGVCRLHSVHATGLFPVMAINLLLLAHAHSGLVSRAQSLQHQLCQSPWFSVLSFPSFTQRWPLPFANTKTALVPAPLQPHRNLAASSEAGLTMGLPASASFGTALPNIVKSLNLNKHCSMHLASIMTSTSRCLPCRFMGPWM